MPSYSFPPRVGIKLPMGVKVQNRHRNFVVHSQSHGNWTDFDDSNLRALVDVYGYNWHVACQALTWNSGDTVLSLNTVRSASQCQERWKVLNQKDGDKHESGNAFDESTEIQKAGKKLQVPDIPSSLSVLVESSQMADKKLSCLRSEPARRRFDRVRKASMKRHIIPLTVPGYNGNTSTGIQTHPSHTSHLQSVQNAVAMAANSSGLPPAKLEMWPLQFLDVAEKQRQNIAQRHQNGNQPPQQHAHSIRQTSVSNHQTSMSQQQHQQQQQQQQQQQTTRPTSRTANVPTAHPNAGRNQEPTPTPNQQPPASSTYGHPMHPNPNSSSRMGTSRR